MFAGPLNHSIIKRAQEKQQVRINFVDIRSFAKDKYRTVDDRPYGGGAGMILRVDIVDSALQSARDATAKNERVILLDPQGVPYTQQKAQELTRCDHLILICGHYEGVDERIRLLVDEEVSMGDFVLTGGEIPAMAVIDSVTRLLPGVLARPEAAQDETFSEGLLEYPHYTQPRTYNGISVPEVLVGGNHAKISAWRAEEKLKRTKAKRPDLLKGQKDRS